MYATECAQMIQDMPDEQLRANLYFLCGWRPALMTEVCECMLVLKAEAESKCESSPQSANESSRQPKTQQESQPQEKL